MSENSIEQLGQQIAHLDAQIASAECAIGGSNDAPAEKPTIFDHSSDAKLTDELGKVFDKHEAREERKPEMPDKPGESLSSRFERSYDWLNASKAQRELQSNAAKDVADLKKVAEQYGLTVEQAEMLKQMQVAQAIAQRYGNHAAPQAQQYQSQTQALAAVEAEIGRVVPTLENFAQYEDDILDVLSKNGIRRTGNPGADLKAAYKEARRRDAKLTGDERLDKRLRRVYDKSTKGA